MIELLEGADGEPLVRIAYSTVGTDSTVGTGSAGSTRSAVGTVRRGPVTLRLADLARLREASQRAPELAAALGWTARPDAVGDA